MRFSPLVPRRMAVDATEDKGFTQRKNRVDKLTGRLAKLRADRAAKKQEAEGAGRELEKMHLGTLAAEFGMIDVDRQACVCIERRRTRPDRPVSKKSACFPSLLGPLL